MANFCVGTVIFGLPQGILLGSHQCEVPKQHYIKSKYLIVNVTECSQLFLL